MIERTRNQPAGRSDAPIRSVRTPPRATVVAGRRRLARPRSGRGHLLGAWLLAALLPVLAGCTTAIRPPAAPADPVEVYLVDHGRTSSLVLPADDGTLVRWAYGDWRWYALRDTTSGRAVAALFWPTRGALGRQALAGPPGEASVRAGVAVEIDAIHPLRVGAAAAADLAARLDDLFAAGIDTLVTGPDTGLSFVHHPAPYTLFHSSNRVVAGWLRELDCRVGGTAFWSRWRVEPPAAERSATIAAD